MEPMMTNSEIKVFTKYLENATNYLEYGSGGSTFYACNFNNLKKIKTIESDYKFSLEISKKCPRADINYINIGRTGICGTPIDITKQYLWKNYSNNYSSNFDLVLIDGRFRVACLLDIILKQGNPIILFHDFNNRPEYHIIKNFCTIIESIDTLVVLKINDNIDISEINRLYIIYNLNSD
jgi:protein O-GlcNAc transferase